MVNKRFLNLFAECLRSPDEQVVQRSCSCILEVVNKVRPAALGAGIKGACRGPAVVFVLVWRRVCFVGMLLWWIITVVACCFGGSLLWWRVPASKARTGMGRWHVFGLPCCDCDR